jgi:hypothetical protein
VGPALGEADMKRNVIPILVAAAAIALPPRGAGADRVREILARHREAIGGGEVIRSVRTMTSTYEMEIVEIGMKGSVTDYTLLPCLTYAEITMGFLTMKQGYDAERIWMIDANGKLQFQRDPASIEERITKCLLTSFQYLSPGDDVAVTVLEPDTVEGTYCEVLRFVPEGGAPCTISFDASTYLIERVAIDTGLGRIVQHYDDYRPVDGLMIPFEMLTRHLARNVSIISRLQSIEINAPIDPVRFLPPAESIDDYRFTTGCSAQRIPFTYRSGHIYLPVRIGEAAPEMMFLLDSGAGMTVIDSAVVAGMDLLLGGEVPGAGAGGMTSFHLTRFPGFAIEGIAFSEQTVLVFPIAGLLEGFSDITVGGVLGYDFLSRFVTRIDYENEHISFFEPDSFILPETEAAIDAPLLHSIFSFEGTIDGQYRGTFVLDTGANNSLLQKRFSGGASPEPDTCLTDLMIRGAGGSEAVDLCRFTSLSFGGVTIPEPMFVVPATDTGIETFEGIDGIIGNDILALFTVTLDYRNQRVLLERNSSPAGSFIKDRSGLFLRRGGGDSVLVSVVIPGSPADEAGIVPGDEIVSIDATAVSALGDLEDIHVLFQAPEGTIRKIVISRSGTRKEYSIVLRSYF